MPLRELIQRLIHIFEVGAGARILRFILLALAVLGLGIWYDAHAWRNFSTPEAMDSAQLARNISEGKGYTTQFIRPLSLYLVQSHNQIKDSITSTNADFDFARIKTLHPDLANAPIYPLALAGLMKILPFDYGVELKKSFWSGNGRFARYQPDFLISMFDEMLLLIAATLTFFLARKLFDENVAWLSAGLVVGCELLWRFSASGLSTMLLLVIFLALAWCVLKMEELAREPQPRFARLLIFAIGVGILTGIGALTRYSFGWTIIPVTIFLVLFGGQRRLVHALAAL
ncbi:MAG TPA: glycosyltransferase family 39 protein, partial [Verrucomicrobiae bacterium]|nr:glycosyltransferase family 39 protein [Verrucomicrobiae bacterium]